MNASWGLIQQWKDQYQDAVPVNWGAAGIELACRIQSNGYDCRFVLLWQLLILSETAFSLLEPSSGFVLHAHLGLEIGGNQMWSVYDLSRTSGVQHMQWEGACRSPIGPLSWDFHWECISSSSLDGNQFTQSIIRYGFWRPKHTSLSNVVKSALDALWIEAYSRKSGIWVSGCCRSSAESLSRRCLLRFTLWSCSMNMEPKRRKLY